MPKSLVAFLFCLISTIVNAQSEFKQTTKPVMCGPLSSIIKTLTERDVDEKLLWIGRDESQKSDYALFVNAKNGAFTIVQFANEIGCILGLGYKSDTFSLPSGKTL